MKNTVIIDIDTDRSQIVKFNKSTDFVVPNNSEEAKKMIIDDISCTLEGLCSLIKIADKYNYSSKEELINTCIKYLYDIMVEKDNN
jgi:predicted nucleotidyltransferase